MKRIPVLVMSLFFIAPVFSQSLITPGSQALDKKKLRMGRSEMAYYAAVGGTMTEIGSYLMDVRATDKTLSVFSVLTFLHSGDKWRDTSISDINTLRPLYRSSYHASGDFALNYGKEVTGYYYDNATKSRKTVKEPAAENYFDSYTYPYLLGLLPLTSGYQASLSVYEYKPANSGNVKNAKITSVTNALYVSPATGEYKVWKVSVLEEGTGDEYQYYIDKSSRRIWKIDIQTKGQQVMLVDKEIDYQPFTTTFDKAAALKMITQGTSVITGEAFARDNPNTGAFKGMAVLNINKKQYAPEGTGIVLVPYTDYFREWLDINKAAQKKGRVQLPLPEDVKACMKMTTVYDAKGNFEFVNLMPGKYLVYTAFGYVHKGSRTEVVGYTDTYINGNYQGTNANTETYSVFNGSTATVEKIITISREGEKVSTKLKKTL